MTIYMIIWRYKVCVIFQFYNCYKCCQVAFEELPINLSANDGSFAIHFVIISGLDTYFFLNLAVGQPPNNMDLSEIEIYLGMVMIFFPVR